MPPQAAGRKAAEPSCALNVGASHQVWRTNRPQWFRKETETGEEVRMPEDWTFVPSGDPALTRRLKADGPFWCVVHRRKNRVESVGLLAPAERAEAIRAALAAERADPAYLAKLEAGRRRREAKQAEYVDAFLLAVLDFLDFHPRYGDLALRLAHAVTEHATPVGSGTVARTERIPIERRAEAAVIAWMRHQTTAYDDMDIARIKGERRRVRQMLAARSRRLLDRFRKGDGGEDMVSAIAMFSAALETGHET